MYWQYIECIGNIIVIIIVLCDVFNVMCETHPSWASSKFL